MHPGLHNPPLNRPCAGALKNSLSLGCLSAALPAWDDALHCVNQRMCRQVPYDALATPNSPVKHAMHHRKVHSGVLPLVQRDQL